MSDETSPRPWRCDSEGRVFDADGTEIFVVTTDEMGAAFSAALPTDAALIVRAVNMHDELVGALEFMLDNLQTSERKGVPLASLSPLHREKLNQARALLTRAKEGT